MGDAASPTTGLSASLRSAGFALGRLKTGTPARLLKSSINFTNLERQIGDTTPQPFSFLHSTVPNASNQVSCHKTYTSAQTQQIVLDNLHRSIHIRETVKGPRYCPSLEAKILRFGGKAGHIVWLEPEGYDSELIYPNGISCSMPEDVQVDLVRSIPGLEKAEIVRPAYGVEYDHVDARELRGASSVLPHGVLPLRPFSVCVLVSAPHPLPAFFSSVCSFGGTGADVERGNPRFSDA
jgi:tRNA uridine 5-carboxymethylaminomethyl modification enzyme